LEEKKLFFHRNKRNLEKNHANNKKTRAANGNLKEAKTEKSHLIIEIIIS
jgi:hypothetical protein